MKQSNLFTSSIGKKLFVALAGLFLMSFLCVHLFINLLMLAGDNGKMFSEAAAFMGSNIVIRIFEVVLFGGFGLHILFSLIVTVKNWAARPQNYYVPNKSETSFFSKYMFHTGIIIAGFLAFHFMHFFFVKHGIVDAPPGVDKHDFYRMAILLFQNKIYSILYLIFFVFLAFHLNHALQSAFQTLGLNHEKYNNFIKGFSTFYAVLIGVGFSIIPIYFMFFYK